MNELRLKVTAQLVALVLLNAVCGALCSGLVAPWVADCAACSADCDCPAPPANKRPLRDEGIVLPRVDVDPVLPQPLGGPVNRPALDEKKQQGGGGYYYPNSTVPMPVQPMTPRESELSMLVRQFNAVIRQTADGRYHCVLNSESLVWNATNHRSTSGFAGVMQVVGPQLLEEVKQGTRFAGTPPSPVPVDRDPGLNPIRPIVDTPQDQLPKTKTFDLALFLDNSARSQEIRRWFESDSDLRYIRGQCNFQIYTPENPTYRTRLSHVVSVQNFPALVLTYADGGHIHAAAEKFIPATAKTLAADLVYYAKLAKSAREDARQMGLSSTQTIGLTKQTGYSWDKAISPGLRLEAEQCPDGQPCPIRPTPSPSPNVDPSYPDSGGEDTLVDRLNKDALVVTGPRDYMALGVIVVLILGLLVARNKGLI